jgi:membrane-associated protease RseP (regulator of RpoE activity)
MAQSFSEYFKNKIKWRRLFPNRPILNIILFMLTFVSTYLTGGIWYSIAIMSILLFHEMGHYFMCRKYAVPATLPFFIPFPVLNPFGTLGAIIRMRGFIPNRRALFDIGAAGPLAGFIICLPAIYWGMLHSRVIPLSQAHQIGLSLGDSLIFRFFSFVTIGRLAEGYDVMLHPLAYAGWAGLFVTSLNLLPIGQLDGGHIVYSIFGKNSKKINFVFLGALGGLVIINPGWILLFALLLLLGRNHPPAMDDITPIDKKRKLLGILIFLIFLLCFTPVPFKLS